MKELELTKEQKEEIFSRLLGYEFEIDIFCRKGYYASDVEMFEYDDITIEVEFDVIIDNPYIPAKITDCVDTSQPPQDAEYHVEIENIIAYDYDGDDMYIPNRDLIIKEMNKELKQYV